MSLNGIGGKITYTPRKSIMPASYNGVRSTGFRGVNVFSSDTVINRTVIVNEDNSHKCHHKSSSGNFWTKLIGGLTGAAFGFGLLNSLGIIKKKDKTDDAPAAPGASKPETPKPETPKPDAPKPEAPKPAAPETENSPYGGQMNEVIVAADASISKAKGTYKEMKYDPNINNTAAELKKIYEGIVQDIKLEQQSNGKYKATITVPNTYKYDGKTAQATLIVANSQELDDKFMDFMHKLLKIGGQENSDSSKNPFS